MATLGTFSPFDPSKEDWTSQIEKGWPQTPFPRENRIYMDTGENLLSNIKGHINGVYHDLGTWEKTLKLLSLEQLCAFLCIGFKATDTSLQPCKLLDVGSYSSCYVLHELKKLKQKKYM